MVFEQSKIEFKIVNHVIKTIQKEEIDFNRCNFFIIDFYLNILIMFDKFFKNILI